jgi:hypothetical protein
MYLILFNTPGERNAGSSNCFHILTLRLSRIRRALIPGSPNFPLNHSNQCKYNCNTPPFWRIPGVESDFRHHKANPFKGSQQLLEAMGILRELAGAQQELLEAKNLDGQNPGGCTGRDQRRQNADPQRRARNPQCVISI